MNAKKFSQFSGEVPASYALIKWSISAMKIEPCAQQDPSLQSRQMFFGHISANSDPKLWPWLPSPNSEKPPTTSLQRKCRTNNYQAPWLDPELESFFPSYWTRCSRILPYCIP
jgi:hypothetical protein